jgi:uncharacterized protein
MIDRSLTAQILDSLRRFPIVGLIGARQTGKTTLARGIARDRPDSTEYLDLERPSTLARLEEAELYFSSRSEKLVILDEIQRVPEIFPLLRSLVDERSKPGQFLILGSASPALLRQSSESLAGRIVYHELDPLTLKEVFKDCASRDPDDHATNDHDSFTDAVKEKLWLRGGFPRSFLAASDADSFQWRESFLQACWERDLPQYGIKLPVTTLRRLWTMIAHCHGQLWNASKIAASLGVSAGTVKNHLDLLADMFLVRPLQPYFSNLKKRIVKSPKVYIRDSGLLHALLRIGSRDELFESPELGASWEGWAMEQILSMTPPSWDRAFYRTSAGAEIDLVLDPGGRKQRLAIEFKHSLDPRPTKGFWSSLADLQPARGFVVYPGREAFPLQKNVCAVPLCKLEMLFETKL